MDETTYMVERRLKTFLDTNVLIYAYSDTETDGSIRLYRLAV